MRKAILAGVVLVGVGGWLVLGKPAIATQPVASGYVFHDRNKNGVRDAGEPGLPDVRVSNQRDIVTTDRNGRWQLPHDDDTIFFVIKPRGWMTPINELNLPRFFYIHKPAGSPANFKYPGVAPTGPLPSSIDFPLTPQREPDRFRAIIFGDTQSRNQTEVEYMKRDVIEQLVGKVDAAFGVTLGDIVFDNLGVFKGHNEAIAMLGIPWYNVLGNHDINYDAANDKHSDETFESIYGPSYYSFDHGPTHFIVVDDVKWIGKDGDVAGKYVGGLGKDQMEFIRNDLERVPEDQLVVLMMHIPLVDVEDRAELYRLIEKRKYALSMSAHTHYQEHKFLGKEQGFFGQEPHHHFISVTVCGSWWTGAPDETGVPHTTMRDGAPNGYSIFTFDGNQYSIEFRAARRPADHQMLIHAPEVIKPEDSRATEVMANVFAGNEKTVVEMRIDRTGEWTRMRRVSVPDPEYVRAHDRDKGLTSPFRPLSAPMASPHMWSGPLPVLTPGMHLIEVRAKDMFGKTSTASRTIRVEP